jgi:ATP-binding cassette, subfamily B, bacterial
MVAWKTEQSIKEQRLFTSLAAAFPLLRRYVRPQGRRLLALAVLFFAGIGLQLLSPQLLRAFIDAAQGGATRGLLLRVALSFLGVALLQQGAALATTYFSRTVAWTAMNDLRRDLARHVLTLDLAFHNQQTPGELLERVHNDVDRLTGFFSELLLQIAGGLLLTLGVLVLLWVEDWRLALILAIFVAAYVVVHTAGQRLAAPQWAKERDEAATLSGFIEERIAGARDLHTSGAVAATLQRFYELARRRTWQALRADVTTDVGWTISKVFYALGTVAGMAIGAYLFLRGQITLGVVYLILHYLALLNGPLDRIADQLEEWQQAQVAIGRVQRLLQNQPALTTTGAEPAPLGRAFAVEFANVTFGYNATSPMLRNVSFQLAPGQTLAILGRTGSGKSTIARLLFRLYDPQQGQIRLNGQEIDGFGLVELRRRIALVTQEVQIFSASVRDNLTLFDDSIPLATIWASLEGLGLAEWVARLPQGLETPLSPSGGLSAGEAQLLALGRAWLKDPGLVILDEAASRLDPATAGLLERALDRLLAGRTALIIAHRLESVRRADQLIILAEGAVVETGTYAALAADPASHFAQLLRLDSAEQDAGQTLLANEQDGALLALQEVAE